MQKAALIIFLLITLSSYSQSYQIYQHDTINRTDKNGLKFGRWIFFAENDDSIHIRKKTIWIDEEGYYKIIDLKDSTILDSYKLISANSESYSKKDNYLFSCAGHYKNLYSVRDGYWIVYNLYEKNKVSRMDLYENGKEIVSRYFNEGILSEETHTEIMQGGKIADTYINGASYIFRRYSYAKTDTESDRSSYYPDCPLTLSNCEIRFTTILSQTDTFPIRIISNSEHEIIIDSISSTSYQIKSLTNHVRIAPKGTEEINIMYTPDRYNLSKNDTLILHTSKTFPFEYKIFTKLSSYDLGHKNGKKIKVVELTKIPGKPLIFHVCDIEWHSWIEVKNTDDQLVEKYFLPEGQCNRLDLSGYKTGEYKIHVKTGLDNIYDYKLILK